MEITVFGMPAPQGSKSFKGLSNAGHAILTESSKKVKPWREAVKYAAFEAMSPGGLYDPKLALHGPVVVEMVFTVPKPASAPKKRKTYPDRKPDLSKLIRSTEDALTDAGVWEDDARVIEYRFASKVYPNEGTGALHIPGAIIKVFPKEAV